MKIILRILQIVLVLAVLVFFAGLLFVNQIGKRALPDYTATVDLRNMTGTVSVYRDDAAVPHIYAENEEDLYRTVGYVMAQDRLWQMDLLRRATTGRLSEIFGKDMADTDLMLRSLRIPDKSKSIMENLEPEIKLALMAFSDGVNQYIRNHGKKLPPEFTILGYEPDYWEPVHSLNMIGYMSWDLTSGLANEVLLYKLIRSIGAAQASQMMPDGELHTSYVFPDTDLNETGSLLSSCRDDLEKLGLVGVFHGSNNWAINDKKSRDGSAIMCNDMHLGYGAPGIWYQMHCVVEGKLNVTGVAVPGQPLVVCGHNRNIAWGMTNVSLDDADLYLEKLNKDSSAYYFNEEWVPLTVKEEKIRCKSGDIVNRNLYFTHRGPIISSFRNIGDAAVSMRWLGNEMSNEIRGVWLLNRAANWEDFRNACRDFKSISQNICYADINGNIGLQMTGAIPVRNGLPYTINPGESDLCDWSGFVPFDEMPRSFNPESGYISSANNKTVSDDYPHYITKWYDVPYRINSIRETLEKKDFMSARDMQNLQLKKNNDMFLSVKPMLEAGLKTADFGRQEQEVLDILLSWDGITQAKGPAPLIFEQFCMSFLDVTIPAHLDSAMYEEFLHRNSFVRNYFINTFTDTQSYFLDDPATETEEDFTVAARRAFRDAVEKISGNQGRNPEKWNWGKAHTITLDHPMGGVGILNTFFRLNRGPFELGSNNTAACPYVYRYYDPFVIRHGPSHRHIYTCRGWDNSLTVIPTGISGIPASDYYCDQSEAFFNGKYRSDIFSKRIIQETAAFHSIIK